MESTRGGRSDNSGDESETIAVPIEEEEDDEVGEEDEEVKIDEDNNKRENLSVTALPPTPPPSLPDHIKTRDSMHSAQEEGQLLHDDHQRGGGGGGHSDYKHQFGHPLPGLSTAAAISPRHSHGPSSEVDDEDEDELVNENQQLQPPFLQRREPPPTPMHHAHTPRHQKHSSSPDQEYDDRGVDDANIPSGDLSTPQTLEVGDAASSTRKPSVVDSLATTATVYRKMDEVPVSEAHILHYHKLPGQNRTTMMGSLSVLYAIFLASLGVVFPLAFFLSGRTREAGICFAMLHVYVTLASIVFIIYLNVAIWRDKKKERERQEALLKAEEEDMEGGGGRGDDPKLPVIEENGYMACKDRSPSPMPRSRGPYSGSTKDGISQDGSRLRTLERAGHYTKVKQSDEGVNWFIKLGLIAFGMGSMVLDGFRLVQFTEIDTSMQCIGLLFLIFTALRLLFTFAQTFFLFKNHRVIIHVNKLFTRFCLLHLVATNICTWAMTVIMEGSNNYVHHQYDNLAVAEAEAELMENITSTDTPYTAKPLNWLLEDMPPLDCYQRRTLATDASPYLFPMVAEYSLLAVAILCRMFFNVGRTVIAREDIVEIKEPTEDKPKGTLECHKANSGLFIGLFLFTLVCITMLFFLLFEPGENPITRTITGLVYFGSDITVNVLSLIALAPAFAQMRKLHFSGYGSEEFNEVLMCVSMAGFYILLGMMTIPALMSIYDGGMKALLSELQAISCILSIIQATVQVVFIFDGLRRRSATRTHFRSKPGRSLVTFILICNVSMWVINTFELKEAMTAPLFTDFYGDFAWIFIVHVGLPLTIFFRFHSTVCLSDIWVNAYKRPLLFSTRAMSPDKRSEYF